MSLLRSLFHNCSLSSSSSRKKDVGKPKAVVAAEFIMNRVAGVKVTPYATRHLDFFFLSFADLLTLFPLTRIYGNIKDQDDSFYRQFNAIICGLDSIDARRWINRFFPPFSHTPFHLEPQ